MGNVSKQAVRRVTTTANRYASLSFVGCWVGVYDERVRVRSYTPKAQSLPQKGNSPGNGAEERSLPNSAQAETAVSDHFVGRADNANFLLASSSRAVVGTGACYIVGGWVRRMIPAPNSFCAEDQDREKNGGKWPVPSE